VVEGGPSRSGPPRPVWLTACILALTAVSTWAVVGAHSRSPGTDRSPAAGPASAVTGPSPPSSPPSSSPSSPWPSAAGACGATISLPLVSAQPLTERIGVRLLVGGYGVRLVDADTATARPVHGVPIDPAHTVSDLVSAGGVVYALSAPCEGDARRIYRLDHDTARLVADTPVGGLLAGADRVWTVHYPGASAPSTARVILRPLGGGRALTLPSEAFPVADIEAGIVVVAGHLGASPHVVLVDPTTGRPVRTLGAGWPLAVDRRFLLLTGGRCDVGQATPSCTIARVEVGTGQRDARYSLPAGRVPLSAASVSRDGRLAVFQLTRTHGDPRFDPGHPIPPADIAVLHLDTGHLDIVPGLELAPKTGAGLIVADDSTWIFAAVNYGDHTDLLAWHPGLSEPRSLARLTGPINGTPLLLIA
jgi:hypothetical protein